MPFNYLLVAATVISRPLTYAADGVNLAQWRIVHMVETCLQTWEGHHMEEKIDFHCVTLEAELGPVGGIYKKPTFGSIWEVPF